MQVTSHDGTILDGWLSFPALPEGVKAPVILISTPYLATVMHHPAFGPLIFRHPGSDLPVGGFYQDAGEVSAWWDDSALQGDKAINALGIQPIHWIQRGFVLANFSIRGAGHSGGCFDTGGRNEQLDQKVLIDWLASQPWSNGRVGMGGLSYPGWTTWQGAVQAPPALKAIASIAPIVNYYEYLHTPQGARSSSVFGVIPPFQAQYGNPAVLGDLALLPETLARAGCPQENAAETYLPIATGSRSRSFFEERNLALRLKDVRAAVLHAEGYGDVAHIIQDRELTASLAPGTPFREVRGWWTHEHPGEHFPFDPNGPEQNWEEVVTGWFEYWLKGVGPIPRLAVDHADMAGTWYESRAWPPPEAREETLFLASGALGTAAEGEPAQFLSAHRLDTPALGAGSGQPLPGGWTLCAAPGLPGLSAVFAKEVTSDLVVAGNPYLLARISSSLPAGTVTVNLYDLPPDFACDGNGLPVSASWLARGGADLEHYASPYDPVAFPVDTPTELRIDISDVTAVIKPGHRIAVVMSHGEFVDHFGQPGAYPVITVYPESRIVLPLIQGSLRE